MKKLFTFLLAATLVLGLAVSCGNDEPEPEPAPEGFTMYELTLTEVTYIDDENKEVKKPGLVGEDLELFKAAEVVGSYMEVMYKSPVEYDCGTIGWLPKTGGPKIHGNGTRNNIRVNVLVDDVKTLIHEDKFIFNMYNGGELIAVTLYTAPEGYEHPVSEYATEGATRIVVPLGGKPAGKGGLSDLDKKIIMDAADTAKLKFYFKTDKEDSWGVGAFCIKDGPPDWDTIDIVEMKHTEKTFEVPVSTIKTETAKVAATWRGLEVNMFDDNECVYIELIP